MSFVLIVYFIMEGFFFGIKNYCYVIWSELVYYVVNYVYYIIDGVGWDFIIIYGVWVSMKCVIKVRGVVD